MPSNEARGSRFAFGTVRSGGGFAARLSALKTLPFGPFGPYSPARARSHSASEIFRSSTLTRTVTTASALPSVMMPK